MAIFRDYLDGIAKRRITDAEFVTALGTFGMWLFTASIDGTYGVTIDNDSNAASNAARVQVISGDAAVALFAAGSGRTSPLITGGPAGAQAVLRTLGGAIP